MIVILAHVLSFVFREDANWVGAGSFYGAVPFAGTTHVYFDHAAVVMQHAFEACIDASLQLVAVSLRLVRGSMMANRAALRKRCSILR